MKLPTACATFSQKPFCCMKHNFIYYFLYMSLFFMNHVLTQERPSREGYFQGSYSYALLPHSLTLNNPISFSFRTCSFGELLSQEGKSGDYLKIELLQTGSLQLRWRVNNNEDSVQFSSASLNNNIWHNVELKHSSTSILLKVDSLNPLVVSNSTARTSLFSANLIDDMPNLYIGKNYTGCILEGSSVILNVSNVISSSVTWGPCPLPNSRSCDGYDEDKCFMKPCRGSGICVNTADGFKCQCTARYSGDKCQIDEGILCSRPEFNLCQNDGECMEDSSGNLTYCVCKSNFAGIHCETPSNGTVCDQHKCNGGTCVAHSEDGNSYKCICLPGFAGSDCSLNIDECESNPCLNNGTCIDEKGSYFCHCGGTGYKGLNCEENINECVEQNPCSFGSTCYDNYGSYVCVCSPGRGGKDCDLPLDSCLSQPCQNGGNCLPRGNSYECQCPIAFDGYNCEQNIDDCALAMCPSNSHCVDGLNSYVCECDEGFTGNPPNCSPNLHRIIESTSPICHASSCLNGGTCLTDTVRNKTTCICPSGFTGLLCESRCEIQCQETGSCSPCNVDACASNPCQNKRSCRSLSNHTYICDCLSGWSGRNCDVASARESRLEDCDSQPCLHGVCYNHRCVCDAGYTGERCETQMGTCQNYPCENGGSCDDTMGHYVCSCVPGFTGTNCETNVDDCAGVTCPLNNLCFDLINGYKCDCPRGFTGNNCTSKISQCSSQPCFRGSCIDGITNYSCLCPPNFTGRHCESELLRSERLAEDPCMSSPCEKGICQNSNGSFRCYCEPGFTGHLCHIDINECLSNPCKNNGECKNLENDYKCVCPPGYEGKECEIDIDECLSSPCINGATCSDSINQYHCSCVPGFTGINCETNIDDCNPNPCSHFALGCMDLINGFHCECNDTGFEGELCDINIDDCNPDPCKNDGSCEDHIKTYQCHCHEGYEGTNCETDINECLFSPCQNGATCFENSNSSLYEVNYLGKFPSFSYKNAAGYFCECLLGFKGDNCEINIDDCENHDCVNGTCIDGINNYHCNCILGFEGKDCSIDINECDKFTPCQNNAACRDLVNDYSCVCQFGYGGRNCEVELMGCRNDPCENEGKCTPYLGEDYRDIYLFNCTCPPGFSGKTCQLITISSFRNGSYMEIDHFGNINTYNIRFQFQTTLSDGVLVHTSDSSNNYFVVIYLKDGSVNLAIQNYGYLKNVKEHERAPIRNDGLWKDVNVRITHNSANLTVSNWVQTESIVSDNIAGLRKTYFGGGVLPSSYSTYQTFIGCVRDIYFNDDLIIPGNETKVGVELGCNRQEQCSKDSCSGIGQCQDFWFSHTCFCPRPYFGSTCENNVTPATFGSKNIESWARIIVPESEKHELSQSTNISLFLRTRQEDGFIFYLGPALSYEQPGDQYLGGNQANSAFVAAFLEYGYLKAVTGNSFGVIESIMMDKKLSNGDYHFLKVFRNTTQFSISINDTMNLNNVTESTLKADLVFIGGIPKSSDAVRAKRQTDVERNKINSAVYNTHNWENITFFKGIIQDFRINDRLVDIVDAPYSAKDNEPRHFPAAVFKNEVSAGVISDNPCLSNPCANGGTCKDIWNLYSCDCPEGYRGNNCSEQEPCSIHQCPVKSTCQNLAIGYECVTEAAFKGDVVLKYEPNFSTNVSANSVSLKFRTKKPGGTLLHIGEPNGFDQSNHLTISVNDYVNVQWKFDGNENISSRKVGVNMNDGKWHSVEVVVNETTVKVIVDSQEGNTEYNNTLISLMEIVQQGDIFVGSNDKPDGFFKGCLDNIRIGNVLIPFFTRDQLGGDESPDHFNLVSGFDKLHIGCIVCWDEFCQHGGSCLNNTSNFDCDCPLQYYGQFCQEDTDECLNSPCHNLGTCENVIGSYKCHCPTHYDGTLCEKEKNYCESSPCLHDGECIHSFGNFTCSCRHEYTGRNCESLTVEKCDNKPCQNGGNCSEIARIDDREFKCECKEGYEGLRCEDIVDYCGLEDQPCENGDCVNTPHISGKKYICHCKAGFEGLRCEIEIDPCLQHDCKNGMCEKVNYLRYKCICDAGYEGEKCDLDIDECQTDGLCKNGAFCTNFIGSYECNCSAEYAPPNCLLENPCPNHNCDNGGQCVPIANETSAVVIALCNCAAGFNGTHCEEKLKTSETDTLALAVGLTLAIVCAICIIVAVFIFLRIAKKKRATRGTYSPSRQEMFGSRVEMNHVMKPPPEERLI